MTPLMLLHEVISPTSTILRKTVREVDNDTVDATPRSCAAIFGTCYRRWGI